MRRRNDDVFEYACCEMLLWYETAINSFTNHCHSMCFSWAFRLFGIPTHFGCENISFVFICFAMALVRSVLRVRFAVRPWHIGFQTITFRLAKSQSWLRLIQFVRTTTRNWIVYLLFRTILRALAKIEHTHTQPTGANGYDRQWMMQMQIVSPQVIYRIGWNILCNEIIEILIEMSIRRRRWLSGGVLFSSS